MISTFLGSYGWQGRLKFGDDGTIMRILSKISCSISAFSLLSLGALLLFAAPAQAEAGFFSSLFGGDAYAQTEAEIEEAEKDTLQNPQTMELLQANVSPASVFKEKTGPADKQVAYQADKTDGVNSETDTNTISDSALLPLTGPLGVSDDKNKDILDSSPEDISIYVVRKGDTVSAIALMFGVSINTILSANDMKKNDKLVPGDVLFILPISGLEHTVVKGQTLKSIAKLYKADVNDIAFYNGIAPDAKLVIGDEIMIPGADNMADEGGDKPAANLGSSVARDKNYYDTHPIQNLSGYFVNPVPTGRKTQGLHGPGNRGIDIGAVTGTPIYASASGIVSAVKTGCKVGQKRCGGGYGNMAIIEHSNGARTLYAHMSKLATRAGSQVKQGEIIGYVGSTGRSTGPHIHFEVFNARNPGSDWSWAN